MSSTSAGENCRGTREARPVRDDHVGLINALRPATVISLGSPGRPRPHDAGRAVALVVATTVLFAQTLEDLVTHGCRALRLALTEHRDGDARADRPPASTPSRGWRRPRASQKMRRASADTETRSLARGRRSRR